MSHRGLYLRVIEIIIRNKEPMTMTGIAYDLNFDPEDFYCDDSTVSVHLSNMAKVGYLENMGKVPCCECRTKRSVYGVTEKGRAHYYDKKDEK